MVTIQSHYLQWPLVKSGTQQTCPQYVFQQRSGSSVRQLLCALEFKFDLG